MKRLLILILVMAMTAAFASGGDFSGETRVDVERNTVNDPIENLYTVDAGIVYTMDWLAVGADVKYNSDEDLDIGLPVKATFGSLILKAEPGADNVREDEPIYVFDTGFEYSFGIFKITYNVGTGSDEVVSMKGKITLSDMIPGLSADLEWKDADNIFNDETGIVEFGVTVKY